MRLEFDLLHDAGNEIAESLGIRHGFPDDLRAVYTGFGIDLAAVNGDDSWTLPMPARYVVRTDGSIASAHIHPDYTQRPEPADTLSFVQGLG